MKKLYKILTVLAVPVYVGYSAPMLAATGQSSLKQRPVQQAGFDASQFKLDMILARRGDADAQYYVGNAYEQGQGTQKSLPQALRWYSKAAAQNQYDAQYRLGYFYENGVGVKQDIRKAMEWYKQAAKNSHNPIRDHLNQEAFAHRKAEMKRSLATLKVEQEKQERERKLAEARARQEVERRQQAAARLKQAALVSKARSLAAKRISIPDISNVVLNNKWNDGSASADYLPSSSTHCLRSSGNEIVCFSDAKQRVINGMRVTYTTKATLTGFKTDGTFHVKYHYNATRLDKASNRGSSVDPNGLKLEQGWQEPQLAMNCRTTDRVNLYCSRGKIRLHYRH